MLESFAVGPERNASSPKALATWRFIPSPGSVPNFVQRHWCGRKAARSASPPPPCRRIIAHSILLFRLPILIDWQRIPLYLGPMADPTATTENGIRKSPATLGNALYAKSKALVEEQEWLAIVQSIAAGDQPALHALYEMAHRVVFTLAMRITANRETAEEITLDVFHNIWRDASRYNAANGTVLAWIMNQARSRAIDRLRFDNRKKRAPGNDEQPTAKPMADPHDILELRKRASRCARRWRCSRRMSDRRSKRPSSPGLRMPKPRNG